MSRLASAVAMLAALLAALPAQADESAASSAEPSPHLPYLDDAPDVGLLPSHRAEWLAGTDAVSLFAPAVAPTLGLGIEAVRAFDVRQRHRLGVHLGVLLGADPETQEPALHLWPGLRYRFSFHMDDLFDWYLLGRLDFPFGSDPWRAGALVPGAGIGVRLARAVAIEGALMLPVALLSEIELDGTSADVWGAFGVSITVDLCRVAVDCEREPPRQESRDCTGELYELAHQTCLDTPPARHAELCEAVMRALDGGDYAPRQGEDSTRAFLRGLLLELGDAPEHAGLRGEVATLCTTHDTWRRAMTAQREASREAATQDRTLRYFTAYAPSAVELRRVLGCFPGAGRERCPALVEAWPDDGKKKGKKPKRSTWTCKP